MELSIHVYVIYMPAMAAKGYWPLEQLAKKKPKTLQRDKVQNQWIRLNRLLKDIGIFEKTGKV